MAEATTTAAPTETEPKQPKPTYTWGVGRRKSACARVRIAPGTGKIEINGRTLNDYFTAEADRKAIFGPLEVTNTGGKMDVHARCKHEGSHPLSAQRGICLGLAEERPAPRKRVGPCGDDDNASARLPACP